MSNWKKLAEMQGTVLLKTAAAGYQIELVDICLTPTVVVTKEGAKHQFPLDKIGLEYSDGTNRLYDSETGEEVTAGVFNDLAVESFLTQADDAAGFPSSKYCPNCGGMGEVSIRIPCPECKGTLSFDSAGRPISE